MSKWVIVEGLTGLGKSTLAHFIARQLRYQEIEANWIHEGELEHPLSIQIDSSIEIFMQNALEQWQSLVSRIETSGETTILEACLFNNLLETLFSHNLPIPQIYQYYDVIQDTIKTLQPALVYLTHTDVSKALAENFRNRGAGFKDYVFKYITNTPYAQQNGLVGEVGMIKFWQDFVALTDQLFDRFRFKKIAIHNSSGDWVNLNQQVLDFLSIPHIVEQLISADRAADFTGTYKDQRTGKKFSVRYQNCHLVANLFLDDWTRLIPNTDSSFIAAGWHFVVLFERDNSGTINSMQIAGQDVDYLSLVGTVAEKVSN